MPGQVTHFYLASRLARQFGEYVNKDIRGTIYTGFEEWLELNRKFKEDVAGIIADEEADSTHSANADRMQATLDTYRRNLLQSPAIAVFSAFTAGAVGPDLWTVVISPTLELLHHQNIRASWFFDLGHYNLSHLFPKYTLKKIRNIQIVKPRDNLQKAYQTAYILGYISHIALDILAHLNVNVFAGAYHSQQPDRWETEQSGILEEVNIFNNHNKVEHYLDAYIRFFCFEGCHDETNYAYKEVVKNHFGQEKDGKYDEWNFPNFSDYYRHRLSFGLVIKTDGITDEDRDFLDLSTCLPGVFVHRYYLPSGQTCEYGVNSDQGVIPFVKQYFWDAYTNKDDWMERKQSGLIDTWLCSGRQSLSDIDTERDKLAFFTIVDDQGWRDPDDQFTTQYYYLQTVIPNMERVIEYTDKFFSPADFGDFIQGSLPVGAAFIDQAMKYLADGDTAHLACLDHWNLDTGMAYRINTGKNTANYEVPVSLDVISVLDLEELKGWTVPSVTDTPVEATNSWDVPKAEVEIEPGKTLFTSHKKHQLARVRAIGIEIQVRQTCFYGDDYGEIGAFIFGDSENKEKPWVKGEDAEPDDKTTTAYAISTCIEDFDGDYAQTEDGKSAGRNSRLYRTVFIGHSGKPINPQTNEPITLMKAIKDRTLARHIKITTCRKNINYAIDTGNFHPDHLVKFKTIYPSEDIVFSLFVLYRRQIADGSYVFEDIFHDIDPFKDVDLLELKRIKIIGLNIILLILNKDENDKVVLEEAWIDGERQLQEAKKDDGSGEIEPVKKVKVLEIEDALFRHDSAVFLPDRADVAEKGTDKQEMITGIQVLRALFEHVSENKSDRLLIAGHTDASGPEDYNFKLSELRANSVLHLVEPDKDKWAEIADSKHKNEDIQHVLTWIARVKTWSDCDPKGIDGILGSNSKKATKAFQKKSSLNDDGIFGPKTWGAVFDIYQEQLDLALKDKGISRTAIQWVDENNKAVGCGESWPIDEVNYRSQTNRRVELLFFDESQLPELKCHEGVCDTEACTIYAGDIYNKQYLELISGAEVDVLPGKFISHSSDLTAEENMAFKIEHTEEIESVENLTVGGEELSLEEEVFFYKNNLYFILKNTAETTLEGTVNLTTSDGPKEHPFKLTSAQSLEEEMDSLRKQLENFNQMLEDLTAKEQAASKGDDEIVSLKIQMFMNGFHKKVRILNHIEEHITEDKDFEVFEAKAGALPTLYDQVEKV